MYDVSPEPDKRKEAIKSAVENCGQFKDFLYKFLIGCHIITDDVASIPYVKTKIEPCVTLKEENQGKSFVNRASFVPIQMEFMDFVDKTIQAGIPKFWDYFEGKPTCIAPNVVVTVPGKDPRFVTNFQQANQVSNSAGEVTFDIQAQLRYLLTLYYRYLEEGFDPVFIQGDASKAFRQIRCKDPHNLLCFRHGHRLMKYHTIPMEMKYSTYWLAAVIEDVFGDMLEKKVFNFLRITLSVSQGT